MRTVSGLFSRSTRRFVACVAAMLFLACQSMAGASAPSSPAPLGADAVPPCHAAGEDAGEKAGDSSAQCQFQNASSTPSTVVYSTIDLPAITVAFDRSAAVVDSAPLDTPRLARIEPPPLRILHCCLRN
jgi:hypothetical protein